MATFVLIHGGGDVGWYWHPVDPVLRRRGHDVVAPDLPCDDAAATLLDYADTVVDAVGERRGLVVVAHSYGGFTAPLVAARLPAEMLVFVAGMVPAPGETRVGCRLCQPVAARHPSRGADEVRGVHRGPILSRPVHATGGG